MTYVWRGHVILSSQPGQAVAGFKGRNVKLSFLKEQDGEIWKNQHKATPAGAESRAAVGSGSPAIEFSNPPDPDKNSGGRL